MDFRLEYGKGINKNAFLVLVNLDQVTLKKNNDIRRPNLRVLGDACTFIVQLAQGQGANPSRYGDPSSSSFFLCLLFFHRLLIHMCFLSFPFLSSSSLTLS
jgi:hypothetical protein